MKHKNKKFIIHPLTAAFYFFVLALSEPVSALITLICSVIHELGHYISARVLGYGIRRLVIYPFGADMELDPPLRSYASDISVALWGPAANILLAVLGYIAGLDRAFVLSNVTLAALNLLPIKALDGGTVLTSVICLKKDPRTAEGIVKAVSFALLFLLWIFAVYVLMIEGGSPSLFVITVTLFASAFLSGG